MEDIFLLLVKDEEQQPEQDGEHITVDAELVHCTIDIIDNEFDRRITKAMFTISGGKSDIWQFGMSFSRASNLLKGLEEQLEAWEACKTETEDLVVQTLADHIS